MKRFLLCMLATGLFGCAGFSGSDLIAGKSNSAEILRSMGDPAERIPGPGGVSVWFYPRGEGRHTYAVTVGPDGVLRSIDQRLTRDNVYKLAAGTTTTREVRELIGPPSRVARMSRQSRDVWEYRMQEGGVELMILWVQFSDDGVVREVLYMRDPEMDKNSGASLP
jgi:hypothetical protein